MNKILYIDENKSLFEKLSDYLMPEYVIELFDNADEYISRIINGSYCLVAINTEFCVDWISCTLAIRRTSNIPILIVSDMKNITDEVTALRIGADDYIITSAEPLELVLRIKSLIRRYTVYSECHNGKSETIKIQDIFINTESREAYKHNTKIPLTRTEFDLLLCFAKNQGLTFTKDQIYENVWNTEYAVGDRNIITHIRRLRNKIEDNPENPQYIHTVRGVGYKFQYQSTASNNEYNCSQNEKLRMVCGN